MTRTVNHRLPVYGAPPARWDCVRGTSDRTGALEERLAGVAECTAVECRHNLFAKESESQPGRRHDGRAPEWTLSGESLRFGSPSCALDVANTGPKSAAEVAKIVGLSKRRIEQITKDFKRSHKALILARLGEE